MKVGLLLCDDVQDQLQPEHNNYPDMFAALLQQHNPALQLVTYRVLDSQFPQSTDECDGWIISGSRHSVNDTFPWIAALEVFVKRLFAEQKKLVGICFGHQLIAKALGGSVILSGKGWGIGVSINRIDEHRPWMQPSLNTLNLLVSHKEQIEQLPDSGRVIASSDFCPSYMVEYGDCFLSVQGHPEFTKGYMEALIRSREKVIPPERVSEGIQSIQLDTHSSVVSQWLLNYLSA
ncbi:GMP synthase [Endozoicomonas sp. (ex Bugula neritina AB1)]|nr:GMP synthase [Endozoicomonas sp. (ex Bugula neritina AB1)]